VWGASQLGLPWASPVCWCPSSSRLPSTGEYNSHASTTHMLPTCALRSCHAERHELFANVQAHVGSKSSQSTYSCTWMLVDGAFTLFSIPSMLFQKGHPTLETFGQSKHVSTLGRCSISSAACSACMQAACTQAHMHTNTMNEHRFALTAHLVDLMEMRNTDSSGETRLART